METARVILERGGAVGIFPEGTRTRPGPLGEPKRGVGRLALETGAPIVPVAIIGTEDIRKRLAHPPAQGAVRCGRALTFPRPLDGASRRTLAQEIANRVWSCVEVAVGVARRASADPARGRDRRRQLGDGGGTLLARGGASVQLVCRTAEQARELAPLAPTCATCPVSTLPDTVTVGTAPTIDLAGADLVCLAVPSRALAERARVDRRPPSRRTSACSC